jgi:hypothetical protein
MVPTTGQNLGNWTEEMLRLLSKFMRNFEGGYGYPPGENRLLEATSARGRGAAEALSSAGAPRELIDFYLKIDEVSMSDVDNGFFIHPYKDVIEGIGGAQPTELTGFTSDRIIVFGSDGGGGLFAISLVDGRVYRLSGGSLIGSTYDADESGSAVVASGFWEFLDHLLSELAAAIAESRP